MKSSFLLGPNVPLEIRELPIPEPSKGEIRVKVQYAALNHRDLWMQIGQYRGKSENLILGSDASGFVDALGEGVDSWKLGDEVIINPSLHWGDQEEVQGPNFQILGNPNPGTFAEYVIVPSENIFKKPSHLGMEESSAIPLAGLTAYRALFTRGKIKKGDTILITGIGGGAAQMALIMSLAVGARVFVSSSRENKLKFAKTLGAEEGFLYNQHNWFQKSIDYLPKGYDLIIDSASGNDFSHLVDLCKPGGTIVVFGGTSGPLGPLTPAKVFWRQINILGTTMGSPKEFVKMVQFFEEKQIKPSIDSIFPLKDINKALQRMKTGDQIGKILLNVGG